VGFADSDPSRANREPLCEGCMNRSDCEDEKSYVACLVAEAECSSVGRTGTIAIREEVLVGMAGRSVAGVSEGVAPH
jgi:hypothetical protein